MIEYIAHVFVMIDHGVVIGRLIGPCLPQTAGLSVRPQVHVSEIQPQEEGCTGLVLLRDEVLCGRGEIVVAGLHALLRERTSVFYLLPSNSSPARFLGCVVFIGCPAVQDAPWAKLLFESWVLWVVRQFRLLFGVQMVEIPKKLIEAVSRRQELVAVSQMVLAKLRRGIPQRLQ